MQAIKPVSLMLSRTRTLRVTILKATSWQRCRAFDRVGLSCIALELCRDAIAPALFHVENVHHSRDHTPPQRLTLGQAAAIPSIVACSSDSVRRERGR